MHENYQPTYQEQKSIASNLSDEHQRSNPIVGLAKVEKDDRIISGDLKNMQNMQNGRYTTLRIPKFRFFYKRWPLKSVCIEMNREEIHEIQDLHKFYHSLGYTADMAMEGILPDEYIWEKFIKDSLINCVCLELNIIEFLLRESAKFNEIYNADRSFWNSVLALAKLTKKAKCSACKTRKYGGF